MGSTDLSGQPPPAGQEQAPPAGQEQARRSLNIYSFIVQPEAEASSESISSRQIGKNLDLDQTCELL